ncbi:putative E3 ubiquitin-protein ligase ARI4 [Fusarium oxysporum f. sp. albedinis]|nr:putative E3 ubiquitin-protein ligase ARI4 [Fusarium oxysporum f. sp. albedinis]
MSSVAYTCVPPNWVLRTPCIDKTAGFYGNSKSPTPMSRAFGREPPGIVHAEMIVAVRLESKVTTPR